jgi:NADH-quinone oxidoreductase subunit F
MKMKKKQKYDELICICMGKKCRKNGSDEIYRFFRETLKKADLRSDPLLIRTKCLDRCKEGPVIIRKNRIITRFSFEEV